MTSIVIMYACLWLNVTEYYVRTFQDGDEEGILRVFEECYGKYVGYVVRTPEYWRWCCLDRPDVTAESVFLVVSRSNERIVGYSVVGKSGNIWELGVGREGDSEEIAELLLSKASDWLVRVGASQINLHAPIDDENIRVMCEKLGFDECRPPDVYVSVLDFQRLILWMLQRRNDELKSVEEVVEFRLKDAPTWVGNSFGLRIDDGSAEIVEVVGKPTISVETDTVTLAKMLLQKKSPLSALVRGKVKVKPFWRFRSFLKLFSVLSLEGSWFTPLSDYG